MSDENFESSPGQAHALKVMRGGENVFLTGAAGTGKSTVVREFARNVSTKTFPLLASTGVAAVLIGGRTFHSFFGLGIMEGGATATVDRALADRKLLRRIRQIDGFLIDEISMLPASALAVSEHICRKARDNELPWGGLQVIAVGDFAQLPPVEGRSGAAKNWAFQSEIWHKTNFVNICLDLNWRTQDDDFLAVLSQIRQGKIDSSVADFLNSKLDEAAVGSDRTHLFPRRDQTDHFNQMKLSELPGEVVELKTQYDGAPAMIEQLKRSAPIPEKLFLKLGSKIMLRHNDPKRRWVNGSVGTVKSIDGDEMTIELSSGREVMVEPFAFSAMRGDGSVGAVAVNFPVNLAYASTIHKSQGATIDDVVLDLGRLWEPGHAYVALSRVREPSGIKVVRWSESSFRADPQVMKFYQDMLSANQ